MAQTAEKCVYCDEPVKDGLCTYCREGRACGVCGESLTADDVRKRKCSHCGTGISLAQLSKSSRVQGVRLNYGKFNCPFNCKGYCTHIMDDNRVCRFCHGILFDGRCPSCMLKGI